MLRVQNQAKKVVSSGLPLAVVVARGDLQVALSLNQNKIHSTPDRVQVPQGSLSLNGMHKLRYEQWGKVKEHEKSAKRCNKRFMNKYEHRARQKIPI
jgi:hypothetical protein